MKNKILSIKRQRDSELITTGYRVAEKMTDNPHFPAPPVALDETIKLLPEFQTLVSNAIGRDMEVVALKKNRKIVLTSLLTELADYVTFTCNGNRSMLLSSGFPLSGEQYNKEEPVIEELQVELGPPGVATTRVKRLRNARAYLHQYTAEPPSTETIWARSKQRSTLYFYQTAISEEILVQGSGHCPGCKFRLRWFFFRFGG